MDDLLYAPGHGLLYRLDPRIKLLFVVSVFVYLILEKATAALLVALCGIHILCLLSANTRVRIWPLWKMLLPLTAMIFLLGSLRADIVPLQQAANNWVAIGPISVTPASLWQALGLSARIASLTFALSLILWTTEPGNVTAGLVKLGLPFELCFPAVMALQQIIAFRQLFYQILDAQQSRGLILARRNPIQAARAYIPVLVPLLISALRQVDDLSLALQSRGFGGQVRRGARTSRRQLKIGPADWLFLLAVWAWLIGGRCVFIY